MGSSQHRALVGNADEVGRTRARQQILDLLSEQQPDGMSPREIAEALEKNYHTTRSILRKMEEAGDVGRLHGQYVALSPDPGPGQMRQSHGIDPKKQVEYQQSTCTAPPGCDSRDDNESAAQSDESDYADYVDYSDDADNGNHTSADSSMEADHLTDEEAAQERGQSITVSQDEAMVTQERHQQETAVISVINRHHCHQMHTSLLSVEVQGIPPCEADTAARAEQNDVPLRRKRCPHHPHARLGRFDPAGQAWCDQMDCWDCYRLMKIGEELGYCCLIDRGGQRLIDQGMRAWTAFPRSNPCANRHCR